MEPDPPTHAAVMYICLGIFGHSVHRRIHTDLDRFGRVKV